MEGIGQVIMVDLIILLAMVLENGSLLLMKIIVKRLIPLELILLMIQFRSCIG